MAGLFATRAAGTGPLRSAAMNLSPFAFTPGLLELLRQPPSSADAQESIATFFAHPEMAALYQQARDPAWTAPIVQACAALLPGLPPGRASMLALMAGSLVEGGADPRPMFPACLALLDDWLGQLQPFCAEEAWEDDEETEPETLEAWTAAQQRLDALTEDGHRQVQWLQEATDLLVLPMMTMVLRDERNHADFIAHAALQEKLAALHGNGSLPFEQLHFLALAACISYEDELAVVLPASGTGFIARVHAANNGFHAFSMLQDLIRQHGPALGVRPQLLAAAADGQEAGEPAQEDSDAAIFQWLQATAYARGALVNEMAWAWGEAPLRSFAMRQGRRVLVALDREGGCARRWSGFASPCHAAQDPHVVFRRYLAPEEVAALLE